MEKDEERVKERQSESKMRWGEERLGERGRERGGESEKER